MSEPFSHCTESDFLNRNDLRGRGHIGTWRLRSGNVPVQGKEQSRKYSKTKNKFIVENANPAIHTARKEASSNARASKYYVSVQVMHRSPWPASRPRVN
jgi:hypothetical protein